MFETIREFAAERLEESGEADAVFERLGVYLVDLAEAEGAPYFLERQPVALARLELEHPNVRAVATWAVRQQRFETVLALTAALWSFWSSRHLGAACAETLGEVMRRQGRVDGAHEQFVDALRRFVALGDEAGAGECLQGLALVARTLEDDERATKLWRAGEALRESAGNPPARPRPEVFSSETESEQEAPLSLDEAVAYALDHPR